MRTEKSRLRRSLMSLQELMRQIRHHTISDQVGEINAFLRGHYAYYDRCRSICVQRLGLRAAVALMRVTDVVLQAWLKHAPAALLKVPAMNFVPSGTISEVDGGARPIGARRPSPENFLMPTSGAGRVRP